MSRMKPDLYTKVGLTVIAFMLVMIGCHQYISTTTVAQAEGPFAGVQFSGSTLTFTLFDSRAGDIWLFDKFSSEVRHTKISAPGIQTTAVQWDKIN